MFPLIKLIQINDWWIFVQHLRRLLPSRNTSFLLAGTIRWAKKSAWCKKSLQTCWFYRLYFLLLPGCLWAVCNRKTYIYCWLLVLIFDWRWGSKRLLRYRDDSSTWWRSLNIKSYTQILRQYMGKWGLAFVRYNALLRHYFRTIFLELFFI
jgi:hypothetical protein